MPQTSTAPGVFRLAAAVYAQRHGKILAAEAAAPEFSLWLRGVRTNAQPAHSRVAANQR